VDLKDLKGLSSALTAQPRAKILIVRPGMTAKLTYGSVQVFEHWCDQSYISGCAFGSKVENGATGAVKRSVDCQ
jgi:hypothetical protein